jgi:hypothetical protein
MKNYGIQGFNSAVYGTTKAVLTLQTQPTHQRNLGFRNEPLL